MCWLTLTRAIVMFSLCEVPRNTLPLWGLSLPPSQAWILCSVLYLPTISWKCDLRYYDFLWPEDSQKSHLPHVCLVYSFLLHPPERGDSKGLHTEIKTERNLPSFYTQSVFVLITSSFMNTHTCTYTKVWKDPLTWRLWKYFLISWDYTFHWVMFKQQIGLACAFTDVFPLLGFEPFSLSGFLQFLEPCSQFCFCSAYLET